MAAAAACLAFVLFSKPGDNALDTLEKDTMQIHDETMVIMADMNRIGRMLKREMNTLDSLSPRRDTIRQTLSRMKKAEEDMYTWMSEYTPPSQTPRDDAATYLEDQKRKIEKNRSDMQQALDAGKKLIAH